MIKKLSELKIGEEGTLVSYNTDGDVELRRHLLGMGFVKGANIKLEKVGPPFGDPIELKVKGYSVCLRKEEAKNIEVEVL